jgi:pimeloyl-ACP methyl ester carboxylesterase
VALHVHGRGEGKPIVVLPSFSLDHSAMTEVFEPAVSSAAGWQRLYVDLPGTGASPAGEPRSDAVLAEVAAAIDTSLGTRPFLAAGWSYGGYLAVGLARRMPERVAGLLLVCTGLRIRPSDRNLAGVLGSVPEPGWLAGVPRNLHQHFARSIGYQTAAVAQRVATVLAVNGQTDEAYLAALRTDGFALSDEGAITPCQGQGPVWALAGRRDRVAGFADLLEAVACYDRATYLLVGAAGHYLPLEEPGAFRAATLAWLAECERSLAGGAADNGVG